MPSSEQELSPEVVQYYYDVESLVDDEFRTIVSKAVSAGETISFDYASFLARRNIADKLWAVHGLEALGEIPQGASPDA